METEIHCHQNNTTGNTNGNSSSWRDMLPKGSLGFPEWMKNIVNYKYMGKYNRVFFF